MEKMNVEDYSRIGPLTIVYDSEEAYELYVLGMPAHPFDVDQRFRTRVDESWWLTDFYGSPARDEDGNCRQVARFEVGPESRYRLSFIR